MCKAIVKFKPVFVPVNLQIIAMEEHKEKLVAVAGFFLELCYAVKY